jgi:Adenylyl/Guanylyl and SMODS C-terminal sensor domain/Second Messenger Oligonucleotide or Dinucleotide Synthetase domain
VTLDLSAYFEQFLEQISLGEPQVGRMDSAAANISDLLVKAYNLRPNDVFLQGSYANGTAIEPTDNGEYDIDIVSVCADSDENPNSALIRLEAVLKSDGQLAPKVQPKKPCVRLQYADDDVGSFHVDVVPAKRTVASSLPLLAPRRNESWRETDPAAYTSWCKQQGPLFLRTVKAAKRWRDVQQPVRKAIKSIVLQVLVASCMPQESLDSVRLAHTFENLFQTLQDLSAPPIVPNPVLTSEDLAASWTIESFSSFRTELSEAVEWSGLAETSEDIVEAADAWRVLLGDDFPVLAPNQLGFELGDITHADSPASMGWTGDPDPRYQVSLSATVHKGRAGRVGRPLPSDGPTVIAGSTLHFIADMRTPSRSVEVWWQVANTGEHARSEGALRGQIQAGRTLDGNDLPFGHNWENTAYTGSHLIRALLVRSNIVVASSDWFRVNIYKPGRSFRR